MLETVKSNQTKESVFTPAEHILNTNYDFKLPRRFMESIGGISTGKIQKLEAEGILNPIKSKHGNLDILLYNIEDVGSLLRHQGRSFKKKKEAEVIAVFSQKGGVGKSSITQHLASTLSLVGKVLVIDLDSQADITSLLGVNVEYSNVLEADAELDPTIAELMDWTLEDGSYADYKKLEPEQVIKKLSPNLHIIPSDLDLGEINYSLNRLPLKDRVVNGETIPGALCLIKEVIEKLKNHYDYIVMDCPPNIEACNVSALYAANRILIPVELEAKCLATMKRNEDFLNKLKSYENIGFKWDRVLVVPNKLKKEIIKIKALARLQDIYEGREDISLSEVALSSSTIIDKCADLREPVFSVACKFGKENRANVVPAKDFSDLFWVLAHEILDLELQNLLFSQSEASAE